MLNEMFNACAALVERGDPERFRAIMVAPVAARGPLFTLAAFNLEVARAPWVTQESMIAEMRLQWWRDALEEIQQGVAVRRHEVVTPLATVLRKEDCQLLDELVAARRWDIYRDPFEDQAALVQHLEKTAGNLMAASVGALGGQTSQAAHDAGFAHGVANWFAAIPALEQAGRLPMADGRPEAVQALAKQALERLQASRAKRSEIAPNARPALLMAAQAEPVLRQVLQNPARVAAGHLGISRFRQQMRLIRQAATGRW